ncbi:MAG: ABC transporter, partial [Gammaproteobacteria bacterium]|nr:ABC transporter [Gammaproteobacteria bacterium]
YLNNAGNLTLGLNILNWLAHEDSLININAQAAPDRTLALSKSDQSLIGLGFLFLIPLALVACGLIIWSRRRRA